ncbi:extracellular solute-binding protein [Rhodovulum sp. 12E13]|uniref:extracellular solute-binding protein n=1 Tax=Rhodovulum sp. 12E13 TaxID=2203891 RepID=UPI00131446FA|nr:extracellular solute-binding protein [Rhodovulum sp. 12E13]
MLLIGVLAGPAAAARVALVIGNGAYSDVTPLPNPRNDATALGATLAGIGFDVDVVIDGDLATMRAAIDEFTERADGAEVALVFYAGHGLQLDGTNYLLPTDIALATRADLHGGALTMDEMFDAFAEAAPETAILILDACRDNPFAAAIGAGQGLASGTPGSGNVNRPSAAGTVIAFSAAPGAVASDGATGNSPYTTALLQWIDRPGIELGTMFRRVRRTVLDLTNEQQVPWVEEALVQDVYLNPAPPPPPRSSAERMEVALLTNVLGFADEVERDAAQTFYDRYVVDASLTADGPLDADETQVRAGLIWLSIRESDDPAVFRAYLDEFPGVGFARLAEERLAELAAAPPAPETLAWLDDLPPVPPRPAVVPEAAPSPAAEPPGAIVQLPPERPGAPPIPSDPGAPLTGEGGAAREPQRPPGLAPESAVERPPRISVQHAPPSPSQLESELALEPSEDLAVQVLLAEAGYYRGPIDGDFGPGTRGGIERLQAESGLPASGFLTVETLRQLVARAAPDVLGRAAAERYHPDVHGVAAIAVGGPGAEPEVVRVEAINRNDEVHAYWREIADAFEADNPGTLIEITHRPGVRYRVELMSILGAETPPDLIYTWSGGHLDALREAGFARDLTDEMAEGWAFEFKPGALQTYTHEGRVYGVPMHLSLISLYANRPVLERAGMTVEGLRTWQGFLRAVETLQRQGIQPITVGGGDIWLYNLYFGQLAQRLGGRSAIVGALAGEGEGFDGPAFRAAGDAFARLVALEPFQPGHGAMDDGRATQMVAEGEAAMILTGSWRLQRMMWNWTGGPDAMDAELVQLPFPTIGDRPQQSVTYGGADGFAVSPEAPDVALDFLRRLTAIDVQERMVRIASDIPAASGADLAVEAGFLQEAAERVLVSTYHQLYLDQELGPGAGDVLNDGIVDVVAGASDMNKVLRDLDATLQAAD